MQISQMMTGEHWGIITEMAIKREDKVERMKTLLETKIKDYVYKYAKLSNFINSKMWFDENEGGWHYDGGSRRIVHAVEEREKCTLELAKLLLWFKSYSEAHEIRDEKRDTTLICYEFTSSKHYLNLAFDKKLLSRRYIIDFKIEYMLKKTNNYYVSRERVELEWVNEKLIKKEIKFK